MNILITIGVIALALFFLGICIFVHELGHLLVALWRGMYIERFSIGMGPKLWGITYKGVEYRVSAIPIGGYVALPQLEPTEEPETETGDKLPPAKPSDRILTALAGPLSNIALGFVIATILWGVKIERPVSVEKYEVDFVQETIETSGDESDKPTPEYEAGLRTGDVIVSVNGEELPDNPYHFIERIILGPQQVELGVRRNGELQTITYRQVRNPDPDYGGLPFPFFSLKLPVAVGRLTPDSPAEKAGIKPGDHLVAVDGDPVESIRDFLDSMPMEENRPVTITVKRDGKEITFPDLQPVETDVQGKTLYLVGINPEIQTQLTRVSPWQQFVDVLDRTQKTLRSVLTPDTGVGAQDLAGPVGIVSALYHSIIGGGWRVTLSFLVLITINLAILNSLPVPVLDGGHIVFGVIEGVTGGRIPVKHARILQTAFMILLIIFLVFITYHDIIRQIEQTRDSDEDKAPQRQTEDAVPSAESD